MYLRLSNLIPNRVVDRAGWEKNKLECTFTTGIETAGQVSDIK